MTPTELKNKFAAVQADLDKMSDAFPWEDRAAYVSWLAQTYEYANFSTRILALTAGHFPIGKTAFSNRFVQHAAEEKGHDKLLMNDAKALGVDLTSVPVLAEAEAFHKSLYFWIYQGRPTVILGWVLALEGFAVQNGPKIFARVEKSIGRKGASFLNVHAHEDVEHIQKAFETLNGLSEADLDEVAHGLVLYARLYQNVYEAVAASVGAGSIKRAA